jgi:hydroxymethylpyrimidine pyrophosphatase-like HAD family hydrolase
MRVVKNEKLVVIDVDDTLVLWRNYGKGNKVSIKDAYSNKMLVAFVHDNNVRLLKEKSRRGYHVIVWSAGGYEHALEVVKALKLVPYVDQVMSKPTCYVDDKPVCDWFPKRVWLDPQARYKE